MNLRFVAACLAIMTFPAPAIAHAFLQHADPGAGATLEWAPKCVALAFSEKLKPGVSGVSVSDAAGDDVRLGPVVFSGKSMAAPVGPLAPGTYRVAWHAVSLDDHRTQGAYTFTVRR
jgi:methionine-rich copper-binding protein CopC